MRPDRGAAPDLGADQEPVPLIRGSRHCARMSRLKAVPALFVLVTVLVAASVAAATRSAATRASTAAGPRNVILMIPDGCGWSSFGLARLYTRHPLALDEILVGACETHSADALITDSAAGATAYASGVKTRNRELGLTPDLKPVATVLEGARARGLSTGLVATSRITHATPAAFAVHVSERDDETEIAIQELDHRVDVLLGGGRREFVSAAAGGLRSDGRDLIDEARRSGYAVIGSRAELAASTTTPLLGLFTPDHMSYEIDRDTLAEPSLAEMARKALALLARNPRGFFIMIEGSRVDHAGHQNDPATHVGEVLAYDEAVAVALEFAKRDGRTLVISVADHETGGLSLGRWSDRDSASRLEPAALHRVRESAARMAGEIRGGAAADEVA